MHQKRLKDFLNRCGSKKEAANRLGIRVRRWDQMVQDDNVTKTMQILIDELIEHSWFETPPEAK